MTFASRFVRVVLVALLAFSSFGGSCQGKPTGRCLSNADCAANEQCVAFAGGTQSCLATCDVTTVVRCDGGQLCAAVAAEDANVDVCLPGGATVLGAACATSSECVLGGLCFQPQGGSGFVCRASCEVGGPAVCAANETCTSLGEVDSPTRGVCLVSGP